MTLQLIGAERQPPPIPDQIFQIPIDRVENSGISPDTYTKQCLDQIKNPDTNFETLNGHAIALTRAGTFVIDPNGHLFNEEGVCVGKTKISPFGADGNLLDGIDNPYVISDDARRALELAQQLPEERYPDMLLPKGMKLAMGPGQPFRLALPNGNIVDIKGNQVGTTIPGQISLEGIPWDEFTFQDPFTFRDDSDEPSR